MAPTQAQQEPPSVERVMVSNKSGQPDVGPFRLRYRNSRRGGIFHKGQAHANAT
jgi:hypothetical protein